MKNCSRSLLLVINLYLMPLLSFSKTQQDSLPHRYLGLGISVGGIKANDLLTNYTPPRKLMVNFDAAKHLRIEGQYGFISKQSEDYRVNSLSGWPVLLKPKDKSCYLGGGLMGMYPNGSARVIAGIRYGINTYSHDYLGVYGMWGDPLLWTRSGKATILSGVLGGEYFFSKYFSVGAEFSIISEKDVYDSGASGAKKETDKTTLTEGNLVFRFFPF